IARARSFLPGRPQETAEHRAPKSAQDNHRAKKSVRLPRAHAVQLFQKRRSPKRKRPQRKRIRHVSPDHQLVIPVREEREKLAQVGLRWRRCPPSIRRTAASFSKKQKDQRQRQPRRPRPDEGRTPAERVRHVPAKNI